MVDSLNSVSFQPVFHSCYVSGMVHIKKCTAKRKGRKDMFYLTTHSTPFIYGYMVSDIW